MDDAPLASGPREVRIAIAAEQSSDATSTPMEHTRPHIRLPQLALNSPKPISLPPLVTVVGLHPLPGKATEVFPLCR